MYFVPREALDIDYCARFPEDVADEYNTGLEDGTTSLTFEEIMTMQRMYAIEDLIAFRHDPYMLHQTNAAQFNYEDPTPDSRFKLGSNYNTSLVALFMQRVVGDLMLYYSLPSKFPLPPPLLFLLLSLFWSFSNYFLTVITVQMDNLVTMFQQRQTMDECGLTTTLGVSATNEIVDVSVTSQGACKMSLSGGAVLTSAAGAAPVEVEVIGSETTAWIDFEAAGTQSFTLATPIPL
jgi:hypothetical protein